MARTFMRLWVRIVPQKSGGVFGFEMDRLFFTLIVISIFFRSESNHQCSFPNEMLMKTQRDRSVFVVKNCTKHVFPDGDTFLSLGYRFENVQVVTDEEINSLSTGSPMEIKYEPVPMPENFHAKITSIQKILQEKKPKCRNYGHEGVAHDYLHSVYAADIGEYPILVHPRCLQMIYFGNHLGAILDQIACAKDTGAHYIAISYQAEHLHRHSHTNDAQHQVHLQRQLAFLNSFPDVYVNPDALSPDAVRKRVASQCRCGRYCWEDGNAPWTRQVPFLREILINASNAYIASPPSILQSCSYYDPQRDRLIIPGVQNLSTLSKFPCLPIIPDVAIQYRCSDNLGYNYGAKGYGVLPFRGILQYLENTDQYIYILAEPAERTHPNPFCGNILYELLNIIARKYPKATILLKRGDDQLLDYIRFIHAKRTICSPSTFCFYAALAAKGEAYFPLTNLIVNADPTRITTANAPYFGDHFHWIFDPYVIFDFKQANGQLLQKLKEGVE